VESLSAEMSVKVRGGRVLRNWMNSGVNGVLTTFFRFLVGWVSSTLAAASLALSQRCIPPGTSHISLQSPSAANASFLSLRIWLPSDDVLGSLFSVVPVPLLVISSASSGVFLFIAAACGC